MENKARLAVRVGAAGAVVAAVVSFSTANGAPQGFTDDKSAALAKQIDPAKPRNVILIIGDGTDDSMITAARNYELGAAGRWSFDDLPFTGAMTTYGLKTAPDGTRYPINYVSDSAPTASGWSTGKKTVDRRISQGPSRDITVPGTNYETVLESYKKQGKRTGNVSNAEITDATPAAAASHINDRTCQGPSDADMATCPAAKKAMGGLGSIAEQLVDNKIDVILGGGLNRYQQTIPGTSQNTLQYAQAKYNYQFLPDRAALSNVSNLNAGPVLGLFSPGNMPTRYNPLVASPTGAGSATTRCTTRDRTTPTLGEMTDKAIDLLDNDKGFFLQVESALIDKQEHAADICGAIGDVSELDDAVKVAQAYQAKHPDTLIIVTGDHAHSTQIVPNFAGGTATPPGKAFTTLQTKDGDPLTIAYSTDETTRTGFSMTHTGTQIRVAASGPQAANVTGTIDQTDIYATLMGRTPSNVGGTPAPTTPAVRKPVVTVAVTARKNGKIRAKAAVAAADASRVTLTLSKNGQVLDRGSVGASGGQAVLTASRRNTGTLLVTATATGPGGTATDRSSFRVRR